MPVLNKFPIWKYLLVLAVVAIGLLYASPNLYGRDPAIQVSGAKGADVDILTPYIIILGFFCIPDFVDLLVRRWICPFPLGDLAFWI